jgi:hypothetical protein
LVREEMRSYCMVIALACAGCLDGSEFDTEPEAGAADVGARDARPAPPPTPDAGVVVDAAAEADAAETDAAMTDAAATDATTAVDATMLADAAGATDAAAPEPDAVVGPCTVRFELRLPDATPAGAIHVAGTMYPPPREWEPGLAELGMTRDGATATLEIELEEGPFDYKYTRGTWETVEVTAGCSAIDDRTHFVTCGADRLFIISDDVVAWQDSCGG